MADKLGRDILLSHAMKDLYIKAHIAIRDHG